MGLPEISASIFPGRRVDAILPWMIATTRDPILIRWLQARPRRGLPLTGASWQPPPTESGAL